MIALKQTVALLAVTMLAALSLHAVSAQDASDAGITADHPLYSAKIAGETGVEGLAPNESEAVEAKMQHADERVAEMDKLSQEGKSELAEQTGNDYSEKMQEVNDLGSRISDLAEKQKINELVAEATQHHQDVLQSVMDRVPEQAQQGIQSAMDQSTKGHEMASKHVAEALQEQGRQDLAEGNDQLDHGDEATAQDEYSDAEQKFAEAEQWLQGIDDAEAQEMRDQLSDAKKGAAAMRDSVAAQMRGDTAAAEQYGQQAQQYMR